jgi:uncharacterized protein involved in exopolysaccharide biosynthesis
MTLREANERVLHFLRRTLLYWPIYVVSAAIGVVAFFVVPLAIPPVFESSTVLLYREVIQADTLLGANSLPTESKRSRNSRLREMVLSRATLGPIIAANTLYRSIAEKRGEIEAMQEMLLATRCQVGESDTLTISFRGDSPRQVVKVTKDLAASMIAQARMYGAEQAQSTMDFLEVQRVTSSKELSKAEQSLAEFLSTHPEFALETAAQSNQMGTAIRAEAREQAGARASDPIAALQRHAERLQWRIQTASSQLPSVAGVAPSPSPPVSENSPAVVDAELDLKRAFETLAERQARYTEKHPDVVAARVHAQQAERRLASARQAMLALPTPIKEHSTAIRDGASDEGSASLNKLKTELRQVQMTMNTTRGAATGSRKNNIAEESALTESKGIVALETEWTALNREVISTRERNDQIQRQLFKAALVVKVQTSGDGGRIVVVDEAYVPRNPVTRGRKTTGAVGLAVVMALGLLTTFMLALMDDRLYANYDVKRFGIGPIAHVVPAATKRRRKV